MSTEGKKLMNAIDELTFANLPDAEKFFELKKAYVRLGLTLGIVPNPPEETPETIRVMSEAI